jgi:hypothetical protein
MPGASAAVSLHDDVAEIFDSMSAGEEPAAAAEETVHEPAAEEPAEEHGGGDDSEAAQESRARDEGGRFTKTPAAGKKPVASQAKPAAAIKPPGKPAGAADGEPPPLPAAGLAAQEPPALKPLQSWKAEAREKWAEVPRWAQEEIHRVGVEYQKQQEASAQDRKSAGEWREAVGPYEHMVKAAGLSGPQAARNLLEREALLNTAPMQTRAKLLANGIRTYLGTDEAALSLLAAELNGAGPAAPVQQPAGIRPEQIETLLERKLQEREETAQRDRSVQAWEEFAGTEPEFLNDVRPQVAALVGVWASENPGQVPTKAVFQDLYDQACQINKRIAPIVKQREAAKAAAKAKETAQKARAAETGLKNEPGGPSGKSKKARTTFDDTAEAYDELMAKK